MENKSDIFSFSCEEKNEIKEDSKEEKKEASKEAENIIINQNKKCKRKNRRRVLNAKNYIEQELKEAFDKKMVKKILAEDQNIEPFRDSEYTRIISLTNSVNESFFSVSENSVDFGEIYFDIDYPFPSIFKFSEDFKRHYSIGKLSELRKIRSKSANIRSNYSFNSKNIFYFLFI